LHNSRQDNQYKNCEQARIDMTEPLRRRGFLGAAASLASLSAGGARADAPERQRWLWLTNNAGEEVALAYRTGQDYDIRALARLQHHFRDLRENLAGPIPPLLLDMLSLIQELIWRRLGKSLSRPSVSKVMKILASPRKSHSTRPGSRTRSGRRVPIPEASPGNS
jgi:hypothetical protein